MPKKFIYEYVNDFSNWYDWQGFESEENTNFIISKNTIGLNASVNWDTNKMTNFYSEKDSIIHLFISGEEKQTIHWKFNSKGKSTKVDVTIKGKLDFKGKIYSVLNGGITSYVGPKIDQSLIKLNNYLINQIGTFSVQVKGLVYRKEINFIEQKDSCFKKDFVKNTKILLTQLKSFVKSNSIETTGSPFIIFYNKPTLPFIKYSVNIPVRDQILTTPESQIQGNTYEGHLAIKTTLKGDYSHLNQAWIKAQNFIYKNKFKEDYKGIYSGIFKKSLPEIKEPSKWETDFYIPIEKKKPRKKVIIDSTKVNIPEATSSPVSN